MLPLDKGLQWVNVKQRPFRQIRYLQTYSRIFRTMCNSGIFRSQYIQNPDTFTTLTYSEPERWHTQNPRYIQDPVKHDRPFARPDEAMMRTLAIIVNSQNYFRSISLPRSLRHEISIIHFLNKGLISNPEVAILCKKTRACEEAVNRESLI